MVDYGNENLEFDAAGMTRDEFNAFCVRLPATSHVVQWGNSDVWKIGGKVFAICGWNAGKVPGITFKVSDIAFEMLRDMDGLRPAPYLASRGMKWIQRHGEPGLERDELEQNLTQSYLIVANGLSRKMRRALGLQAEQLPEPGLGGSMGVAE